MPCCRAKAAAWVLAETLGPSKSRKVYRVTVGGAPRPTDAPNYWLAFDRSGLSAAAFARQQGIGYTTFCGWRHRRTKAKGSPAFVEVELPGPAAAVELLIEVGTHTRLRISSAGQVEPARPFPSLFQRPDLMLSFHAHLKVFVATAPCDLRANFNGLWTAAQERLGGGSRRAARSFVFGNRRRNRIKLLYFDGTGVCVLANMHAPQCAVIKGRKNSLSLSSFIR